MTRHPHCDENETPSAGHLPCRVCVVGLGYIGLPTAAILAECGHEVVGIDVRQEVIQAVNAGRVNTHEPGLDEQVHRAVQAGRLRAAPQPEPADVFILCVPTPVREGHVPDLSYVEAAADAIRPWVRPGNLIVLESTSPPGTTEKVVVPRAVPKTLAVGRDVFVAHCPERVLPGRILVEVVENDRVVGGLTPKCTRRAAEFYRTFVTGRILETSAVAAELSKLVENAFRDVNIAFANEISMLAQQFGADPFEIIDLANHHPRVNILCPGPGVGGHCIRVDPWFLIHAAPDRTPLMRTAREVNDFKPQFVLERIDDLVRQHAVRRVGCLGLSYKADVDDLRESPSLEIVRQLHQRGDVEVLACEPYLRPEQFREFPLHSLDDVLGRAEMLVLLTDHAPFRAIPAEVLRSKVLLDVRGVWRHMKVGENTPTLRMAA